MPILNEPSEKVKFSFWEKEIHRQVCELGCNVLKEAIEAQSDQIHQTRDKKKYRDKGTRKSCIKTLMGPVEYSRHVYQVVDETGKSACIYLLDQWLGMDTIGHMSECVVDKIVEGSSAMSFRKAAKEIKDLTGLSISHAGVWNVVQEFGKGLEKHEETLVQQYDRGELNGTKEISVLFEEADGDYLCIQRRNRGKRGKERKELKLAVTYEGWKRQPGTEERYHLVNKCFVSGFMESDAFKSLRQAKISETYNVDKIQYHVLNGDGAGWIRQDHHGKRNIYQMDPFHWRREVLRAVADKREAVRIQRMLVEGEMEQAIARLTELKFECGGEETRVKALQKLQEYLLTLSFGIQPWQHREGVIIPEAPQGSVYRNMGTMEHHICDVVGLRMKGRKMSWSIAGGNHMGKILACKMSGEIPGMLSAIVAGKVPEKLQQTIETILVAVKEDAKKHRGEIYQVHRGGWPYEGMPVTPGRNVIREIFKLRDFTELTYK